MNVPQDNIVRLRKALRSLKHDPNFDVVKNWIKGQLAERDQENRYIGMENKSSEAQCLADMLKIIAAGESSNADSDSSFLLEEESESAPLTM
jgi:hypothetical protein